MESVILDTDVFSFLAKADSRGALYLPDLAGKRLSLCFQTVAELHLWVLVRHWNPARRDSLTQLMEKFVILPYDSGMALHWAELTAYRRQRGRPIDCGDAWIAAAALRHDATLLTHNAKDYEDIPHLAMISHGYRK